MVSPLGMEQILTAVAASVMHSASGMSKWGMADLTLGLYKLAGCHALEGAIDTVPGVPVDSSSELDEMLEWLGWATAAYEKDIPSLASTMKVREDDIVLLENISSVMKPAYFIGVHRIRRCVVMGIRGTSSAKDVLTDLNPHSEPFEGGYAHSGMLAAAKWLLENEGQRLHDVLQANPGFGLVLAGHSLGAGTAALLALMLREPLLTPSGPTSKYLNIPAALVTCWGFGCPPCVDLNLAMSSSFIFNVVLQDDVVARVSPAALEDLRSEMSQADWSQAFKDDTTTRRVLEMLQAGTERFSKGEVSPETMSAYNKAKESGYSALVNAGGAMVSKLTGTKASDGTEAKSNSWLAFGAAVAGTLFTAAHERVTQGVKESLSAIEKNVPESDEGVAASALAANAAASTNDSKEVLGKRRLFVPGQVFHIIREPSQQGPTVSSEEGSKSPKVRHRVVKGSDPKSRFGRIVLSSSMLSDHSTPFYSEALVDALQHLSTGPTGNLDISKQGDIPHQ